MRLIHGGGARSILPRRAGPRRSTLARVTRLDARATFATTRWGLVRAAGGQDPAGRAALGELCARYGYPLYAYLRRGGHAREEADDLVQGFFASLIERDELGVLEVEGGRFRGEYRDAELAAQTLWAGIHGVASIEITHADCQWVKLRPLSKRAKAMCAASLRGMLRDPTELDGFV